MAFRKGLRLAAIVALVGFAGSALRPSPGTQAQTQSMGTRATQATASYNVELDIEAAMTMLTPMQAQGATMGEVMVSDSRMTMSPSMTMSNSGSSMSPSMSMTGAQPSMASSGTTMTMATTDNGQPVNHHLEVHVTSKSTGSPAANIQPQISITDDATGQTRALASVMSMYDIQVGQSDLHYGNNVYLPDGGYTVTVVVGSDMAQFSQVMVSDGMGLPPDSMGAMGDSMGMDGNPMQMPGH